MRLDAAVTAEQRGDDCRGRAGDVDMPPGRTVPRAVSAFGGAIGDARLRSATRSRQRSGERAGVPEPEHVPTAPATPAPTPAAPGDAATARGAVVVAVVAVVDATAAALGPAELAEAAPEL